MRWGLRLQILVLLGGLLGFSLVPLFFSISTYTRVALRQVEDKNARALSRAVAAHVGSALRHPTSAKTLELLEGQLRAGGVRALALYDVAGGVVARAGDPVLVDLLDERAPVRLAQTPDPERIVRFALDSGEAMAVFVPVAHGTVAVVAEGGDERNYSEPLSRVMALYMVLIGLGALVGAYVALTRWIVRPVDALSQAAERVALGGRELHPPRRAPRELTELGESLRAMTRQLRAEEEALRHQIDEVERTTRRLQETQATLVRSERLASVGRLAAGLAHEVGNPISALMGFEDLLLAGGLTDAEQRDFLERMKRETARVHRILRDLLQFARTSSERPAEGASGHLAQALADVLALVRPQTPFKNIELDVQVPDTLPAVPVSHEQLVQVFLNLLMNAADALGGRGTIRVDGQVVDAPRDSKQAPRILVRVEDDGPGVPNSIRARLFEPFVTSKEVGKGTGLGLAVSRGIIEAAGGSLDLDESFDSGARFVIELPVADEAHATRKTSTAPAPT